MYRLSMTSSACTDQSLIQRIAMLYAVDHLQGTLRAPTESIVIPASVKAGVCVTTSIRQ